MKCIACEQPKPVLCTVDILLDEPTTVEICHACLLKCPWPILHPTTGRLVEPEEVRAFARGERR